MNAYVVHTWIVDLKEGLVRYVVDKSEDAVAARQASKQFSRKFWTQKLLESRGSKISLFLSYCAALCTRAVHCTKFDDEFSDIVLKVT
jgi:hypothetical protein